MRKVGLLLVCVAACKGPAQEARKETTPPPSAATVMPPPVVGEEVAVEYRTHPEGQALIEIAAPAGARVDVREGQALVGRDTAPMAIKAEADHWYMVAARLPSGAAREAKVQARAGQVASLRFVDVPQGPQAMSREGKPGLIVTGGSKVPGCPGMPWRSRMFPAASTTRTSCCISTALW